MGIIIDITNLLVGNIKPNRDKEKNAGYLSIVPNLSSIVIIFGDLQLEVYNRMLILKRGEKEKEGITTLQ